MTAPRVELQIDELVLEGVPPAEAEHVGAAMERELARLVRDRGLPSGAGAVQTPAPASIDRPAGEQPAALGTRLAGAVYGRLGP